MIINGSENLKQKINFKFKFQISKPWHIKKVKVA